MTYEKTVELITHKRRFGGTCGRDVTDEMMGLLGHPERSLRVIHIAGTNGKGSVAAFVSSILRAASFCVGMFTSPHLVEFTERIQVDGEQISREDVARLGERLLALPLQSEGTMFDYCLAMACLYFQERNCDYVVLETGLGGRLDSTAGLGVTPEVCAFTNIGYDHTEYLGTTLAEIAAEKAGILKPGCRAVIGEMEEEAAEVIIGRCRELGVPWERAQKRCGLVSADMRLGSSDMRLESSDMHSGLSDIHLGLPGAYQRENAATAAAVFQILAAMDVHRFTERYVSLQKAGGDEPCRAGCDGRCGSCGGRPYDNFVGWKENALRRGLEDARWPGRMEILCDEPFLMVDGAHNPQGAAALAASLREAYPGETFIFVMGVMADKAYGGMLFHVLPLARLCLTVTVDSKRSLSGEALAAEIRRTAAGMAAEPVDVAASASVEEPVDVAASASVEEAMERAAEESRRSGCRIIAFGSLYFVGSIKERYR